MIICNADADVLLYKACYGTEYTVYTHPEFGTFRRKKELKDFLKFNVEEDDPSFDAEITPSTVTEPFNNTKIVLDGIITSIRRNTGADRLHIYVSGGGPKLRDSVSYPVKYKDGRAPKPSNFKDANDYLLTKTDDTTSIFVVTQLEVDDALGINQGKNNILATIDKDLDQIPGWHYHIDRQELYQVSEEQGIRFFWEQMLSGDRTDNIIGIDGLGPVKSKKMLEGLTEVGHMEQRVKDNYTGEFEQEAQYMFEANFQLLKILRTPPENYDEYVRRI